MRRWRTLASWLGACLALVWVIDHHLPSLIPAATPPPSAAAGSTLQQLAEIPTGAPSWSVPYQRSAFGPAWADMNRTGCDTRNQILAATLSQVQYRAGTHSCVVISGTFIDPYSATAVTFTKADASAVQIDHIVPLAWAWRMGASAWTPLQRQQFANDLHELQPTTKTMNQAKGDAGPSQWLPPNEADRCRYADVWVQILRAWNLPVTAADRTSLVTIGSVNFDWPHGDGLFWPHVYPETGLTESSHSLVRVSMWGFEACGHDLERELLPYRAAGCPGCRHPRSCRLGPDRP